MMSSMAESVASDLPVDDSQRAAIEELFRTILDANGPALARLAASYTRSTSDRDDLLQDIALAIWRALPRFRGECSVRTFVLRIAHNRSIAHLSQRRAEVRFDDERVETEDPAPSADVQLTQAQRLEQLAQAVRQLPLVYRQVIALALEGLAYKEIADVLGITESNVGVRLNRARDQLKGLLEARL
jgi:RNA polymerase sigma factor (sigma-70 family)